MGGAAKSNCKGCGKKEVWVTICGHFLQLPVVYMCDMCTYMKTESVCNYTSAFSSLDKVQIHTANSML